MAELLILSLKCVNQVKEENAGYQHFLLFSNVLKHFRESFFFFCFFIVFFFFFSFSNIGWLGKGMSCSYDVKNMNEMLRVRNDRGTSSNGINIYF